MFNNKYYLVKYYKEDSRIHKIDPKIKIITLLLMIISLIISKSIHNLILLNLYILTIILYSNIKLKNYLKQIYNLKIIIFVIGILSLLITFNIYKSTYTVVKVIDIILLLSALIMTTTPLEINAGLTNLLDNKIINLKKIILKITLSIISIPLIQETQEQIKISKLIRGLNKNNLTKKEKILSMKNDLESTYRLTNNKITRISKIMELKNYSYNLTRTNYKLNKNKKIDTIVLILNLIIFVLVIIY